MKKIFTFLIILAALVINAQVPAYVPTNGLVGYWPFNGNVNDESGNNNNCNNPLGNYDNDRNGTANSSFYGSGSGSSPGSGMYISSLDNFPLANSSRTISVWFKSNLPYPGGNRELFSYGDNTFGTRFGIMLNGSSIGVEYVNGSVLTTFIPDNNWHIITVTYNGLGSSGILIYLDGTLRTTTVSNPIDTLNTLNSFVKTIGRLNDIYNFSGNYDDIGIWNRALSQQEITNLYNSSLPQTTCLPAYVPTNGLVGYWPFCGNANDESGNGNNGTPMNGVLITSDRFNTLNSAYSFDGIDDRILINNAIFNNGLDFTFSSWCFLNTNINPNNGNNSHPILNTSPHNGLGIGLNWGSSNKYSIFVGDGTPSTSWNTLFNSVSNQNIEVQTWKFITVIKSSNTYSLYINGVFDQTWIANNSIQSYLYKLYFGGCDPINSNEVLNGKLDDIGIWNRALSQQEITNLYNSSLPQTTCLPAYVPTNGLVGYWPFCGNANDESGNGNNGILGNGVNSVADRFGLSNSAYTFTGSGNISLTNLPTTSNSDFTITGWIKTDSQNLRKGIACWGQDTPWASTYFFVNSSGFLEFDFAYNAGPISTTNLTDNSWHFVSATCNGGLVQLYIDGIQTGNSLQMSPNIIGNNKSLGSNIDNSGQNNFVGSLDDIGIWNRALTQQEITNLYNSSLPQTTCLPAYVPSNGLVGYWPFCGNANDESGNGNNGTVNGAVLSMDRNGNLNSAYSFDGVNDNIGLGNFFNFSTFSISMWVKPGNQNGHAVIIDNNHSSSNNWVFQTISNFSNNGYNFQNSNEVLLSINNWSHLVLSYGEGYVRVYLNGNLVSVTQFALNYNNSPSLFLGYWQAANARFWKGDLDDIGIWNRALTQQEITGLYDAILNTSAAVENNEISIYPNPAKDRITIDCGNLANVTGYIVKIVNMLGQEVYSGAMNKQQVVVPINSWSGTGVYFVKIYDASNNLLHTKKIIVQ